MSTIAVTIVQGSLHWHDALANRNMFEEIIRDIDGAPDLIILPEMFTTGFTMDAASCAETMDGATVNWMSVLAREVNATICGSLIILEAGQYYNRFVSISQSGQRSTYDKRHLFRLADEQQYFSAGDKVTTFEINGWRICPMICYDLRFPVWSRNTGQYDLLLYVANWPSRRHLAWETLLRARAIENLSFVAAVNRTGIDGNELPYSGGSAIVNYLGEDLANLEDKVGVSTVTLDLDELRAFRERFAFHLDADKFSLNQ